jgi:hypothetical protein
MQSYDLFHNRKTSRTSMYLLLFRDKLRAEFCTDHEIGVLIR